MCLGIPGQVIRMLDGYEGQLALVDVTGEARKVNVGMLPDETFETGDWVIIHMGPTLAILIGLAVIGGVLSLIQYLR